MTASPLPWRRFVYSICDANGEPIAGGVFFRDCDLEMIVRAVNSHAALVAALEDLIGLVPTSTAVTNVGKFGMALEALASAKGDA